MPVEKKKQIIEVLRIIIGIKVFVLMQIFLCIRIN